MKVAEVKEYKNPSGLKNDWLFQVVKIVFYLPFLGISYFLRWVFTPKIKQKEKSSSSNLKTELNG